MDDQERSLYNDDDDWSDDYRQEAEDYDNQEMEGEENYCDDY